MGEDQRLVDPPAARRPPVGRRIAGGEFTTAAARRVVGEPQLGRGQVEVRGEMEQGSWSRRAADPRLVADELVGQIGLADLGQRDRGADVRARDSAPFGIVKMVMRPRAGCMPSALAASMP